MRIIGIVLILLVSANNCFAYLENYPPYSFGDKRLNKSNTAPVVDPDNPYYKSADGRLEIALKEDWSDYSFFIKYEGNFLAEKKDPQLPLPHAVYLKDLDNNGQEEIVAIYSYRGNGLAANNDYVEIYVRQDAGGYSKIYFDAMAAGIEDFADMDNDGKCEVMVAGLYNGEKHNYFTYNIYRLENGRLVNADEKIEGFPKVIWFTDKRNDKNTTRLTEEEKKLITYDRDKSIQYE